MTTSIGNARLRAARQSLGLRSQAALADAVNETARTIGLRLAVTARTVRRWESASPPWPHPEHAAALEQLFQRPVADLGFTPPWSEPDSAEVRDQVHQSDFPPSTARPRIRTITSTLPASVATDYAAITSAHRRLYWLAMST